MGLNILDIALTLIEAQALRDANRHLQGTALEQPQGVIVECVAIAPADDINKWIFLQNYITARDPLKALDFYKVPFFDVVMITRCCAGGFSYMGVRNFKGSEPGN